MDPSQWDALVALIPPRSRRVAVIAREPDEIAARFRRIQPEASVQALAHEQEVSEAGDAFDAVVIEYLASRAPGALKQLLAAISNRLTPDGQVIVRLENATHWPRVVGLLRGRPVESDALCATLEDASDALVSAGLSLFGVDFDPQAADDLGAFTQLLAPALRAVGVEPSSFLERASIVRYTLRALPAGARREEPLLIQTLIGEPLACARPRVHEPNQFLRTIPGVHVATSEGAADLGLGAGFPRKVFVRQRHILSPDDLPAQRALLDAGYLVVAEFDDDPDRFPAIAAHGHLTFSACHAVQTSTEALADLIRQWNPIVGVFPNQLLRLPDPPARPDRPVSVFFGALNREADWAPLVPGLNRLAREFGEGLRFRVVYDAAFFDAIDSAAKDFEPFCTYGRYLEIMESCQIALMPLEDTRFNRHKSDLKFLEASSVGAVAVASPTVYGGSIEHGRTGFLCPTPGDFESTLARLVRDPAERRRVGEAARAHVGRRRMLADHYASRYEWYRSLFSRRDELRDGVLRRVPALGRP